MLHLRPLHLARHLALGVAAHVRVVHGLARGGQRPLHGCQVRKLLHAVRLLGALLNQVVGRRPALVLAVGHGRPAFPGAMRG